MRVEVTEWFISLTKCLLACRIGRDAALSTSGRSAVETLPIDYVEMSLEN